MEKMGTRLCWTSALALLVALLAGCQGENNLSRREQRGDKFFTAGDYSKAEIEYLGILRQSVTNAHAIRQLALIYLENGRIVRAFPFLQKAAELVPDDTGLRLKLGALQLSGGDFQKARETAGEVLARDPMNETALLLLAETARTRADQEATRKRLEQLRASAGDSSGVNLGLGALLLKQGDLEHAESAARRALELAPRSIAAHQALSTVLMAKGDPTNAALHFQQAADLAPARSPVRLQQALFLIRIGRWEDARQRLTELTRTVPDYLPAWITLAELALTEKKFDDCSSLIKEALARDPELYDALLLRGRLHIETGEIDKAIGQLEPLAAVYTRSPAVHYHLGIAFLLKQDAAKALSHFNEAVTLNPEFDEALLQQARLNIRRDNIPGAIASLTQLLKRRPQLAAAHSLMAQAHLARGSLDDALATYTRMREILPQDPQVLLLMGTVLQQQGRVREAQSSFEQALQIAEDYLPALEQLVNLDLSAKRYNEAITRVRQKMTKQPQSPELHALLARVYLAQENYPLAEQILLEALKLDSQYIPGYRLLAQTYLGLHQDRQALEKLDRILANQPSDAHALLQTAMIRAEMKEYAAAAATYEKLLAINPRSSVALNNLACLYSEQLNQLDKAYEAARKARQLLPNDPATGDTLGWILYRRGEFAWALSLLGESAERLPTEPEVLFHAGMTHYMMGHETPARSLLQRALNASADPAFKEEATARLAVLNANVQAATPATLKLLEQHLARHPEDPVALSRLAFIYERNADAAGAARLYSRALEKNPGNLNATIKLAQLYAGKLNDSKRAIQLAKTARSLAPEDPDVAHTLGRLAFESGEFAWSLGLLQESQRKQPQNPELLYDLALTLASVGRLADADVAMKDALKLQGFSRAVPAERFLKLLAVALTPGKERSAAPLVQAALKENPRDLIALAAQASLQEQGANNLPAAKETYETLLRLYPLFTPADKALAGIYRQLSLDPQEGYEHALKARTAFPDDPQVAGDLGILSYGRGEYTRAVQLLKESAAALPQDPEVLFHLGLAHHQLKQKAESQSALRKALALNLDAQSAQEARRILAEAN